MKQSFYLKECLTNELKNVTENTKLYHIAINNKSLYVLIQFVLPITEDNLNKELYKSAVMNDIDNVSSKALTYRNDIKIFLYGEDNLFINEVIKESKVTFSEPVKKDITLNYSHRLVNNHIANEEGISPELYIDLETGIQLKLNIEEYILNDPLYLKDNKVFCNYDKLALPRLTPKETEYCNIVLKAYVDNELKSFESDIYISIDNTEQLKKEKENTLTDIELIADALFEIDNKLNAQEIDLLNVISTKDKSSNCMADMWVRWIITKRKTLEECPEKYLDYVKSRI